MNFSPLSCLLVVPHDWLLSSGFLQHKMGLLQLNGAHDHFQNIASATKRYLGRITYMTCINTGLALFPTFLHKINNESASDRESLKPNEFYRLR